MPWAFEKPGVMKSYDALKMELKHIIRPWVANVTFRALKMELKHIIKVYGNIYTFSCSQHIMLHAKYNLLVTKYAKTDSLENGNSPKAMVLSQVTVYTNLWVPDFSIIMHLRWLSPISNSFLFIILINILFIWIEQSK